MADSNLDDSNNHTMNTDTVSQVSPITTTTDLVLFSYASPFADTLMMEERQVFACNRLLHLGQRYQSGGKGGTDIGFGASVYNASIALSFFLEAHADKFIKDRIVVELGCGPALVSIVSTLAGAALVVCTDGDDASLELAQTNIIKNTPESSNVLVRKLYWGDDEHLDAVLTDIENSREMNLRRHEGNITGNVIVASDIVAPPYVHAYSALIKTLLKLCGDEGVVVLSYQRRHSSDGIFWKKFRSKFIVEEVPRHDMHADFVESNIYICTATPRR